MGFGVSSVRWKQQRESNASAAEELCRREMMSEVGSLSGWLNALSRKPFPDVRPLFCGRVQVSVAF